MAYTKVPGEQTWRELDDCFEKGRTVSRWEVEWYSKTRKGVMRKSDGYHGSDLWLAATFTTS